MDVFTWFEIDEVLISPNEECFVLLSDGEVHEAIYFGEGEFAIPPWTQPSDLEASIVGWTPKEKMWEFFMNEVDNEVVSAEDLGYYPVLEYEE